MKTPTRLALLALGFAALPVLAADAPPEGADPLSDWLKAGRYKSWAKESARHPSAGPHPSAVQTYLNPSLDASLREGRKSHPVGAAAVKELFDRDGRLSGWAVSRKMQDDSAGGKGWYWYEVLSTGIGASPVADGRGVPLCAGCHAGSGRDFVLIPHPLK